MKTKYETGATSHAVNDLILFVDNTKELVALRDSIYRDGVQYPHTLGKTLEHGFKQYLLTKAMHAYRHEFRHDPDSYQHIVNMTEEERTEFCKLYADDFDNWKFEHGINTEAANQ